MNFENDISQRALDSYDIARHDAVDALRKNFNIQSIYEYGTVKAPGISDLDLMIVMNAASAKHHALRSPSDILPDHVKSIAAGGAVMVLDEKLFSTINTWDEVQVKLLWGDQIKMAIGSYSSSDIHLARAIDWIPERILRLVQMPHMESVKTSRAIGLVYSLCHSLRLVIQEFNPESSAELSGFTNRVDALRDEWFNSDPPSRNNELAECIGAGAKLAIELIPFLASKLLKTGLEDLDVEGEFRLGRTGSLEFRRDHDYGAESLA